MKRRTLHEILRVSEAAHNNDIKGAAKVKKRNCHTRKVRHSSLFLASAIQIQFAFLYAFVCWAVKGGHEKQEK